MSGFRELFGVALSGVTAKFSRTLLIMLGPIIGVAAMVCAIGLTDSQRGDLKRILSELGTDLVIVNAESTFGGSTGFPDDVAQRARNVSTVTEVSAVTDLSGIIVAPYENATEFYAAVPVPVIAADTNLPDVLGVELRSGRWLNTADSASSARAAVIGISLAGEYAISSRDFATITLNGIDYTVVGILDRVQLREELDDAVFISPEAAERDFVTDQGATRLFLTAEPGTTEITNEALPTAIALGGNQEITTIVPSDALVASAESDKALRNVALAAGALSLFVGGIGIANVMSISVIQRSAEIGIRRALGHSRSTIAGQFLLEALFVGVAGAIVGAAIGVAIVAVVSAIAGWTQVIQYRLVPLWMGAAVFVSVLAGLYPAVKAARLEPLETLRLG